MIVLKYDRMAHSLSENGRDLCVTLHTVYWKIVSLFPVRSFRRHASFYDRRMKTKRQLFIDHYCMCNTYKKWAPFALSLLLCVLPYVPKRALLYRLQQKIYIDQTDILAWFDMLYYLQYYHTIDDTASPTCTLECSITHAQFYITSCKCMCTSWQIMWLVH